MTAQQKLLVLSSGGDAPGMNAAIRSVVRTALHHDFAVYGCEQGFTGLIEEAIFPMHVESVANCLQRGGTILKTARCEAFRAEEIQEKCTEFLIRERFTGLIVLGGNGSFQGAGRLVRDHGIQVIGIPCTIDNDINGTDYCIGFDTACNTALESIDRIRDTALSHDRNFLIEVMGRSSGFLAVEVGIAAGAEFILIPEFPLSTPAIAQLIQKKTRQKLTSIIVAAEAGQPGHCIALADEIEQLTGLHYKTCILGHIQRGGSPTVKDRVMATEMGVAAVNAIRQGYSHQMVARRQGTYQLIDLPTPEQATQFFSDDQRLQDNQIVSGITPVC